MIPPQVQFYDVDAGLAKQSKSTLWRVFGHQITHDFFFQAPSFG
jgi:hypothetical protein